MATRMMRVHLQHQGCRVNRKRVQRLIRTMGIRTVYPHPRTSIPCDRRKVYTYLLKGLRIDWPNYLWATDITYLPLAQGFMHLVALIDGHSRKVLQPAKLLD